MQSNNFLKVETTSKYICQVCNEEFNELGAYHLHFRNTHSKDAKDLATKKLKEIATNFAEYVEKNINSSEYGTYAFAIFLDKCIWRNLSDMVDYTPLDDKCVEPIILGELEKLEDGHLIVETFKNRDNDYTKGKKMYIDFNLKDL